MFQIIPNNLAELATGWTGANPYGMARVTLAEHVARSLAIGADEYESTGDGAWSAIVPLSADDAAFLDFCELVDSLYVSTPDAPYPFGTFSGAAADTYDDRDVIGSWSMLVDVDDRGWLTYSIETAADAADTWERFVDSLPCFDECCEGCDREGCESE